MADDLLNDIATYLLANGIGTAVGQDIFLDTLPEIDGTIIAISEYAGTSSIIYTGVVRRVQIRVRASDTDIARNIALRIYDLVDVPSRILNYTSTRWSVTQPLQPPTKITVDDKGRTSFAFNIAVTTFTDKGVS